MCVIRKFAGRLIRGAIRILAWSVVIVPLMIGGYYFCAWEYFDLVAAGIVGMAIMVGLVAQIIRVTRWLLRTWRECQEECNPPVSYQDPSPEVPFFPASHFGVAPSYRADQNPEKD